VILVDSSVWIDHFRGARTGSVARLHWLLDQETLLVGDLILCEVLRGTQSEAQARTVERRMREFEVIALSDAELAVKAADNYRALRRRGLTIRTTVDLIIGTFCIERGHALLHSDRDFEPMERYLGLQTV
jgi:predicted nucleic acid-binding protein